MVHNTSCYFPVRVLILALVVEQQGYCTKSVLRLGLSQCWRYLTDANLLHCSIWMSSAWPVPELMGPLSLLWESDFSHLGNFSKLSVLRRGFDTPKGTWGPASDGHSTLFSDWSFWKVILKQCSLWTLVLDDVIAREIMLWLWSKDPLFTTLIVPPSFVSGIWNG